MTHELDQRATGESGASSTPTTFEAAPAMTQFSVAEITDDQLEPAYALIRTLAPDVPLERWLAYAQGVRKRGGMLGLFAGEAELFGLLTYRREECLRYGVVLLVENFVTFELSRASPGRKALCSAVDDIARDQACAAVRLVVGGRGYIDSTSTKTRGWIALGHNAEAVILTKSLDGRGGTASPRSAAVPT